MEKASKRNRVSESLQTHREAMIRTEIHDKTEFPLLYSKLRRLHSLHFGRLAGRCRAMPRYPLLARRCRRRLCRFTARMVGQQRQPTTPERRGRRDGGRRGRDHRGVSCQGSGKPSRCVLFLHRRGVYRTDRYMNARWSHVAPPLSIVNARCTKHKQADWAPAQCRACGKGAGFHFAAARFH